MGLSLVRYLLNMYRCRRKNIVKPLCEIFYTVRLPFLLREIIRRPFKQYF